MDNITGCFETSGEIDWTWEETDGEYEIKVFPVLIETKDGYAIDSDIRLDIGDALTYFDHSIVNDEIPSVQWHLSGSEEGACHIEGMVGGIDVWLWFLESPPEEIADEIVNGPPPEEDPENDPELNLN